MTGDNGKSLRGARGDPAADARRCRLPDRGDARERRQPAERGERRSTIAEAPPEPEEEPTFGTSEREKVGVVACRPAAARRHQLRRGELDAGRQVDRDLRGDPRDRADHPRDRAQAARPLPGALRTEPGRARGPDAADGRRAQAAHQGGLQARQRGSLPLGDRAGPGDHQRHRDARDHPLRRRHQRRHRPLRDRRPDRHPLRLRLRLDRLLRPAARRLGVGLEVQLHGRDALRRAADLLRDLDGPGAARRDHDGRLAQPGRASPTPRPTRSGTSSPSSSAS